MASVLDIGSRLRRPDQWDPVEEVRQLVDRIGLPPAEIAIRIAKLPGWDHIREGHIERYAAGLCVAPWPVVSAMLRLAGIDLGLDD